MPTHGLGAFASSGCRRLRVNKRVNQLCGFLVGGSGLALAEVACWGFTFSELGWRLREVFEPPRSAWDAGLPEFDDPVWEPWFEEPAEERDSEPPAFECEAPDDPPPECEDDEDADEDPPPEDPDECELPALLLELELEPELELDPADPDRPCAKPITETEKKKRMSRLKRRIAHLQISAT